MLKFLYDLEDGDSTEANIVTKTANLLSVGEFQVFQLGYADWYGRDADPKLLEDVFFAYLYHHDVPPWARHFSRKILALYDKGQLDYNAAYFHRFDPASLKQHSVKAGSAIIVSFFLGIFLFFAVAIALLFNAVPDFAQCQYPPCIWDERQEEGAPAR